MTLNVTYKEIMYPKAAAILTEVIKGMGKNEYHHLHGLCYLLAGQTEISYSLLEQLGKKWPKFSGDPEYPVPCPNVPRPCVAYHCTSKLYDQSTEYGRNRLAFAKYLLMVCHTPATFPRLTNDSLPKLQTNRPSRRNHKR